MIRKFATAAFSSTVVTSLLLYLMQALINLNGPQHRIPTEIPLVPVYPPPPDDPPIIEEPWLERELLDVSPTPDTHRFEFDSFGPIGVPSGSPTPRVVDFRPKLAAMTDGPLMRMMAVQPVYPIEAISRNLEGFVDVEFDVLTSGATGNVRVIASSHSIFERAAIKAAEKLRYKPEVVDGIPLTSTGIRYRFRFQMDR